MYKISGFKQFISFKIKLIRDAQASADPTDISQFGSLCWRKLSNARLKKAG